jgi:AraC-like DNA-binding protein
MKISEVPQDDVKALRGERKALYAVDEHGRYTQTSTRGWEVEEIVLQQVIDDFEEQARRSAVRVRRGETSPIEYFMHKRWMDPLTLAQAMGLYRWQVRRHFRPEVFRKLKEKTLMEYARILRVSVDTVRSFRGEE